MKNDEFRQVLLWKDRIEASIESARELSRTLDAIYLYYGHLELKEQDPFKDSKVRLCKEIHDCLCSESPGLCAIVLRDNLCGFFVTELSKYIDGKNLEKEKVEAFIDALIVDGSFFWFLSTGQCGIAAKEVWKAFSRLSSNDSDTHKDDYRHKGGHNLPAHRQGESTMENVLPSD